MLCDLRKKQNIGVDTTENEPRNGPEKWTPEIFPVVILPWGKFRLLIWQSNLPEAWCAAGAQVVHFLRVRKDSEGDVRPVGQASLRIQVAFLAAERVPGL